VKKTNAVRLLDKLGFPYRVVEYDFDENELGAASVASKIGMPLDRVYKTLVVRGDKTGIFLSVIPGGLELDLKAAAGATGNKRCELVHLREVLPLTGYQRGGVSPLGSKKAFPVIIDESSLDYEEISVSAGLRGMQMVLSPSDLVEASHATVGRITRD
jgi:Cys-tRNA(Pro)/Cys-tRNA(Cys) deacylase